MAVLEARGMDVGAEAFFGIYGWSWENERGGYEVFSLKYFVRIRINRKRMNKY